MIKRLPYLGACLAALLCAFMSNAARADIKELVDAGKISWTGNPEASWVGEDESELLLKFTDTTAGSCSFSIGENIKARVRVVAVGGGGAGGTSHQSAFGGGGGGAGAMVDCESLTLEGGEAGSVYAIVVGAGGTKAADDSSLAVGNDGTASSFGGTLVSAMGGGGGGASSVGRDGACGGGGSGNGSSATKKKDGGAALAIGGNAGGLSKHAGFGAGGGGMGSQGGASSSSGGGAGGSGKAVDITGETLYLAAGGGGGRYSGKTASSGGNGGGGAGGTGVAEAGDGVDGTGSGGGGSGNYLAGGKGGDGVVYVRVTMAAESKIDIPVIADRKYTGDNIVAFDFGFAYEYVSGTTNAVDAGTYEFQVRPAADFEWRTGEGRAVKTIAWKILPCEVEVPVAKTGLVYNGSEQIGSDVALVDYYLTDDSVIKATNAGTYSFTVVLWDKVNTCWVAGSTDDVTVCWSIAPKAVAKPAVPTGIEYSGTNSVAFAPGEGYVYAGGTTNSVNAGSFKYQVRLDNPASATNYVWSGEVLPESVAEITNSWAIASKAVARPEAYTNLMYNGKWQNGYKQLELQYYTAEPEANTNQCNAGTYDITFTLRNPSSAQNYVWNSEPVDEDDWYTDWSIARATNAITNLKITGWKLGTTPIAPTCDALWGKDSVGYSYSMNLEEGPWESAVALTNAGTWWVRAIVPETKNWLAATNYASFVLWDNPANVFAYSVKITIPGNGSSEQKNYQALIELSEKLAGFSYADAGTDGKELAFLSTDDTLLHYKVKSWVTNGTSKVGILLESLPAAGTAVTLYWGVRSGQTAPTPDETGVTPPSTVTTGVSYGLVEHDGKKINYWKTEPSITPNTWDVDAKPEITVNKGTLAEGTVSNYYYDVYAPTNTYGDITQLTEAGYYRGVFMPEDSEAYEPLVKTIDIRITASDPYVDVRGNDGDSGRVLLMNNDTLKVETKVGTTSLRIDGQGYVDTTDATVTYWVIPNDEGETMQGTKSDLTQSGVSAPASASCPDFNIKIGRSSTLLKNDGTRLWHLEDCRHGNSYMFDPGNKYKETYTLNSQQNFLPFSSVSYDIMAKLKMGSKAKRRSAGQIVMRNRTTAAVYSPCFTNGFGTLYFDAVNDLAKTGDGYKLAVEWATNAVNDAEEKVLPLDENCYGVVENVTNWYQRVEWHDATMLAYKRDGSDAFGDPVSTTELALEVTNGGTDQNFYRIAVPLNFDVPARIRIVRRSTESSKRTKDESEKPEGGSTDVYGYDNGGFILLDNVIVSYPPMWAEMTPVRAMDSTRHGKQVLGNEISTTVPYPAVGEASALIRAKSVAHVNGGTSDVNTNEFVASAKAHYRWRYLNQQFGDWKELDLNPMEDYQSMAPVEIPNLPGDIEYWLECNLQAPFYGYVDYSGTGLGIPYSEERKAVTNRLGSAAELVSGGTDWFFRLRDCKSDRQGVKVVVEGALAGEYELALMEDHTWRGFIPNPTNVVGDCSFKFVGYNRQTPGATGYVTNTTAWGVAGGYTVKEIPATGKLGADGDGIEFAVSHLANYYEVRMNEETLTWSLCTAEYQNFNQWSDAEGTVFTGSSTMGNRKGTSPQKKTYAESFDDWAAMSAANTNWTLFSFSDLKQEHLRGRTAYKQIASDTDNSWSIGPGMWVAKYYADQSENSNDKGVAYQMKGCGEGYVQYIEKDSSPRGIETISFNARLGQYIDFSDFCYYDGGSKSKMTNYVFIARGAFDHNDNKDFAGNASLSLVACYHDTKGCYEARWEQINGAWKSGKCTGAGGSSEKGQRLCLYRWNRDRSSGKIETTLLGAWTNTVSALTIASGTGSSENSSWAQPLMISVESDSSSTKIAVGVAAAGTFGEGVEKEKSRKWYGFCHVDSDAKKRLTAGTYGMLAANCPGRFNTAASFKYSQPITWEGFGLGTKTSGSFADKDLSGYFPKGTPTACMADFDDDNWIVTPGRMTYVADKTRSPVYCYLESTPAAQTLDIWTAPAGTAKWSKLKTIDVGDSFGTAGVAANYEIKLYSVTNCSVKISTGGVFDDPRNDVIIDSVVISQFRGNDYSDTTEMIAMVDGTPRIPTWTDPADVKAMTNFIFTSAWIRNNSQRTAGSILLSAKRAAKGQVSGIRSPLMDGNWERGKGLGMFSFDYANAQPNARLLVQLATNSSVSASTLCNHDNDTDEGYWVTCDTIDFSTLTGYASIDEDGLKSGTWSRYFGLHDQVAAVRVIVDPSVVGTAGMVAETDPAKFGEVEITKVLMRDEPALGLGCWLGWNLRMVSANREAAEKRMYLPDYANDSEYNGLSAALNKSATADVDPEDDVTYRQNVPFVESPAFGEGIIGEVNFRARKYGEAPTAQPANVRLYGSTTGDSAGAWETITDIAVTGDVFTTYSYRVSSSKKYKAFRLGVTGAADVRPEVKGAVRPEGYDSAVRVLLDEVIVSQAMEARVGFRNVGAFRSFLKTREFVPNVPSAKEQPLCNEGWGVQCEVYAAQQADEINFDMEPVVYLHYFVGEVPWGYEKWAGERKAKTVRLPMCVDSNLVYRSTYLGNYADTVVPMSTMPGEVVQYTLEVRWWKKGSLTAQTNFLGSAEWTRPDWYRPLDLNAQYGGGESFAAYNILDTVAPDWAWINEANVFGRFDSSWNNSERDAQFVEVAVPVEADISGWSVRLIGANVWNGTIVTNTIGRFGSNLLPGLKKDAGLYSASNMVFRVIGSPNADSQAGGRLDANKGQLDATWTFETEGDTFKSDGEIFSTDPFGIQLVRASGIIEHEVVCVGTNYYGSMPGLEAYYDPANTVNFLNSNLRESRFFYAGQDAAGEGRSLGVFVSHGEGTNCWNNTMTFTPGRINQNQSINPDHPTPNGETILVYATVDNSVGHLVQTVGDEVGTNGTVIVYVTRGSQTGTNITYRVDPWYELGSVTQNGKESPFTKLDAPKRTYVATVGVGASNNVTVIAKAQPKSSLVELGVTDDDPFTPAIMKWLSTGKDAYGNDWADPDADEVKLAQYLSISGHIVTNMTLKQMYWLDMDPTVGNLALKAGMIKAPLPTIVPGYKGTEGDTNIEMCVYMMITNRTEDKASKYYGDAKPPYILRGLAPDETSWNCGDYAWTSETFKVTGILANGHTSESIPNDWIPLRWFVFTEDSFVPCGSEDEGRSVIQVRDPYSKRSPGFTAGWYAWKQEYGEAPVFFSWALDTRIQPVTVEPLKQENKYDD